MKSRYGVLKFKFFFFRFKNILNTSMKMYFAYGYFESSSYCSWVKCQCLLQLDGFTPSQSAMDVDYAHQKEVKEREKMNAAAAVVSPSREAYKERVAEALDINRTKLQRPSRTSLLGYIPQTTERTLEGPDIADDFYLNSLP